MPSRRTLLLTALSLPAAWAVGRLAGPLTAAAIAVRPPASGSSATRCAACGAADHAMLDARCPAAPRVLG